MNGAHRPGTPRSWNPKADKQLYFYSESLDMNFPVSRLDWADWYEAFTAASPHLHNEYLLATLLRNATMETRFTDDHSYDMPWYERENYVAQAVITAGWEPPRRPTVEHGADNPVVGNHLHFCSESTEADNPAREWSHWYATVSTANPQLDDLHLLGELIHAVAYAAHEASVAEHQEHAYLAHAIIIAGWTPPAASHETAADV